MRLGGLAPAAILLIAVVGCTNSPAPSHSAASSTRTSATTSSRGTAPAAGAVQGHLTMYVMGGGGAVPGTVTASGPVQRSVSVGTDGAYSISLPPGIYRVEGRSPRYPGGTCLASDDVIVVAGVDAERDVNCLTK